MKYLFLFLLMSFLLISCNGGDDDVTTPLEETEVSLLGTWRFIEVRVSSDTEPDPDSGLPFIEIESEKTITFYPDNIIESNGNALCVNSLNMGEPTTGVYNPNNNTFTTQGCFPGHNFPYTQTDSTLVIQYIYNGISEGKYKKIADLEE